MKVDKNTYNGQQSTTQNIKQHDVDTGAPEG